MELKRIGFPISVSWVVVAFFTLSLNLKKAHSEGQSLDFTGVTYLSAGVTYSFDWGNLRVGAGGPEFSIGNVYDDPYLFSISTGALFYDESKGWRGYLKANGGTMMLGGSLGLSLNSIDRDLRLGAESDLWIGIIAYGVVSYKLVPGYSGFGTGFKIKAPYPIRHE